MRPFTRALGILALMGIVLTGCGGDDDDTVAVTSDDDPGTTVALDDVGDDDEATDGEDVEDSAAVNETDDGDEAASPFCGRAEETVDRLANLASVSQPSPDIFADAEEAFADLADGAPEEVRDDLETLASVMGVFADAFEGIDPEDPASLDRLEEQADRLEEEGARLDEAGRNIEAFFREQCGIELSGGQGIEDGGAGATSDTDAPTEGDGEG